MIIIASRSTHKGYDNSVNTGRVKFRSRGCQTRTHDVCSTQHKFNCSFIHLLVWKNEWNCRKQTESVIECLGEGYSKMCVFAGRGFYICVAV